LDSDTYVPKYKNREKQDSKLDSFKEYIKDRISKAHPIRLSGVVLFREIKELKYTGGITLLRDYIREEVYFIAEKEIKCFETEPGKQMLRSACPALFYNAKQRNLGASTLVDG
jgi:transposase